MKIIFCGGAGEVGASCILVKMENKNILLDCGIRMSSNKDMLPDLSLIQENGGVDAIIISHGHTDHIGALPLISKEYPDARIYMTHATKDLTRVLLYDSLKIMNRRETEIPIYSEGHVQEMLGRILCFSPENKIRIFNDSDIELCFYHAGHIIGAACVYLTSSEGSLFYSGDFSTVKQATIDGAAIPKLRPDVAIMETTYGDRLHSNRQIEEERLIDMVKNVTQSGGKVIIPVFAVGRAQEIILILKKAMNKGSLPSVKIYIDGMVKDVCRIYKLNPNYLKNELKKKIIKSNKDIFFDDNIMPVDNAEMRNEVLSKAEACCIISSSGMVTGGPVVEYIKKFAPEEKNFIAITGYQDEEAPGRRILELLDEEQDKRQLQIDGITVNLKCGIGKYGLSAHGDKNEILGLLKRIEPRKTFLVHGDGEIINSFSKEAYEELRGEVYTPKNDDIYDINFHNPRKQISFRLPEPLHEYEPLCNNNMARLWEYLWQQGGYDRTYTIENLCYIWRGYIDEEDKNRLYAEINHSPYFESDERRAFLFHAKKLEDIKTGEEEILEVNKMLEKVDEYFTRDMGLYKKGARQDQGIVLLSFVFPHKIMEKYKDIIADFEEKTGWKVEVNENCNQMLAERYISDFLNKHGIKVQKVAYYSQYNSFKAKVDKTDLKIQHIENEFYDETGIGLEIDTGMNIDVKPSAVEPAPENRMEINQAFAFIEKVFEGYKDRLHKKSKKQDNYGEYIELSFVTPLIGAKYKDVIRDLEKETLWRISISDRVNQNDIIAFVISKVAEYDIPMKKNPSIHMDKSVVRVYPEESWDKNKMKMLKQELTRYCGYDMI